MLRFKKIFKQVFALLLIVTILPISSFLIGCNSSTGSGDGLSFFFTIKDTDDYFRSTLQSSLESAAKSEGATVTTTLCGPSADQQVSDIKAAAESGNYDAIICVPVDSATALQLEIAAGDLPVIFMNNKPDDDVLKADEYVYVASDEYQAGELQAEYMYEQLGKPSSINAIIMMGERNHSGTLGRTEAVKQYFKDNNVDLNIVFCDYASWSDTEAANMMEIFFKTNQDVDVIFCNNDTMALGVIEALDNHGLTTSDVPVAGVDATSDGCKSIAAGKLNFTVYQNAEGQSTKAIEVAIALANGSSTKNIEGKNDASTCYFVDFEAVSKSNVSKYQ
ncbi:sugar ABC transporter substrate-binding protein [Lachnospira pectinoschiza]|uniref:Inositol transport system substrate-binding protein n=1 Tax=Lachnospira pectinoschiza TaxID=28052 RepID=A0A1G9WI20_9FIRM|nr:sugar ABC transporter substrate-binding protein [Lachnospira pectinoschiza]SDM83903.1 inositol transport system substrate-binding protein [Lachnospira pectinoschiza]